MRFGFAFFFLKSNILNNSGHRLFIIEIAFFSKCVCVQMCSNVLSSCPLIVIGVCSKSTHLSRTVQFHSHDRLHLPSEVPNNEKNYKLQKLGIMMSITKDCLQCNFGWSKKDTFFSTLFLRVRLLRKFPMYYFSGNIPLNTLYTQCRFPAVFFRHFFASASRSLCLSYI